MKLVNNNIVRVWVCLSVVVCVSLWHVLLYYRWSYHAAVYRRSTLPCGLERSTVKATWTRHGPPTCLPCDWSRLPVSVSVCSPSLLASSSSYSASTMTGLRSPSRRWWFQRRIPASCWRPASLPWTWPCPPVSLRRCYADRRHWATSRRGRWTVCREALRAAAVVVLGQWFHGLASTDVTSPLLIAALPPNHRDLSLALCGAFAPGSTGDIFDQTHSTCRPTIFVVQQPTFPTYVRQDRITAVA